MSYVANLIVPIEMLGRGCASSDSAEMTFSRSTVYLNPGNYDGATYYFEIVATNSNATYEYDVSLYDATNASVKATIPVAASTTYRRFRSSSFSPASGNNSYQLRIEQTAAASNVAVHAARIIIVQVDATKTRIQIPFVGATFNQSSPSDGYQYADMTQSTSYTQGLPSHHALWTRTDANWGTVASYDFDILMNINSASYQTSAKLYNVTDSTDVDGTEFTEYGTTWQYNTVNLSTSATNFHNGDSFDVRHKTSNATYQSYIGTAFLYVNLTELSKGEVYWRTTMCAADSGSTAANNLVYQRVKLETDGYSSPVCYHEATIWQDTSGESGVCELRDHGTNEYGSSGSATVTNSALDATTTRSRVRGASALTGLTSGNSIIARKNATTNTHYYANSFVVVQFTGSQRGYLPGITSHHFHPPLIGG